MDHWHICGLLDLNGGNANGYLDRCHAILLFVGAGLLSLFWMISELDGGWSQMMEIGNSAGKFTLFNLTI